MTALEPMTRARRGRAAVWALTGAFASAALMSGIAARSPATSVPHGIGAGSSRDVAGGPERVRYGRDIRPILSDRCFLCHGTDEAARAADLRLDEREDAVAVRGAGDGRWQAIVPGDPDASELWRRITSHDADEVMPPPSANKRAISDEERALIRRWIEQGAVYEPHWAFVPPVRHAVPAVMDESWPRDGIDGFVLAELERRGIAPSPEADRATLLRRVYLDLTGLPPTPEELRDFLSDPSPDAYEKRVRAIFTTERLRDRLAERLTAPWLDAARYADTNGIHTDAGKQMWLWRDWVIQAFRDNMPYDRFLTEQLAGDLLPGATVAQHVATGFNRNHVMTDEGGAIAEEYLVEYAVDRVSTTSTVFLGLTMACARCHDHKYDPITATDFYSMLSFFNSIDEPGLYSQLPDANRAFEPMIEVSMADHAARLAAVDGRLAELRSRLENSSSLELAGFGAFARDAAAAGGVSWSTPEPIAGASSEPGVVLSVLDDGSFQSAGRVADTEDVSLTLRTQASGLRLMLLEALSGPGTDQSPGRAANRNMVLSRVTLEQRLPDDPSDPAGAPRYRPIPVRWAWADHAQQDRDYEALNVIRTSNGEGWATDYGDGAGNRLLLLLTDEAFGVAPDVTTDVTTGATADATTDPQLSAGASVELRVTLGFRSQYTQHTMNRVRVRVGTIDDTGLARLPLAVGRWYTVGPFAPRDSSALYDDAFGPEASDSIDPGQAFDGKAWAFTDRFVDGEVMSLPDGMWTTYLGRTIASPQPRTVQLSLGSDDGFAVYLNGVQVAERRVNRGVAPDQDRVELPLRAGLNTVVIKVVNTGGLSGAYARLIVPEPDGGALNSGLVAAVLPGEAMNDRQRRGAAAAWARVFSDEFRALDRAYAAASEERRAIVAATPRAMVMRELPQPRPTFVLTRGLYDQPDPSRPVTRAVPKALGSLPDGAPPDRLGLAAWMTAAENPLVARVAVNRFWELVFGVGLVGTSDDFGLQGEWPSHPELLDTLAVDFRESGWDVHGLIERLVLSSTYRQSSRVRQDVAERDPGNRWLSFYPRRRLTAEQVRDQALFVSGALVERVGGPSVKPYQPEGLWPEVSMPASNTRVYEMGSGPDLYRRSIYTYWKRAVPPPTLQTLDAPTREACTTRRVSTNTPLQALALWNDTQFVEAARLLAERTLTDKAPSGDRDRVRRLFERVTCRTPETDEERALERALTDFRASFRSDPSDAASLLAVGSATPAPELAATDESRAELAAWTMLASAVLNSHEAITQD